MEWDNYVNFDPADLGTVAAFTGKAGYTTLYPTDIQNKQGYSSANATMIYSNNLIHEVFWFGVLGEWVDNVFASRNELGAPPYSDTEPRKISPDQARDINAKFAPEQPTPVSDGMAKMNFY